MSTKMDIVFFIVGDGGSFLHQRKPTREEIEGDEIISLWQILVGVKSMMMVSAMWVTLQLIYPVCPIIAVELNWGFFAAFLVMFKQDTDDFILMGIGK